MNPPHCEVDTVLSLFNQLTQTNDVAIVRPPGRRPLLIAAYYDAPRVSMDERETVLREVGRVFVDWTQKN